ncbi:MAG: hypothetical protein O3C45_01755 [Bacteroidetes bacterium]|nr:hypothetical protein [Bacteroidota bacterium]MDA0873763.1 hypothetical protein [Bacteroidota bacterium]
MLRPLPLSGFGWVIMLGLWMTGCGQQGGLQVDALDVQRLGWDSLDVTVRFSRSSVLSAGEAVVPDLVTVTLFDESYDTLYTGPQGRFAVYDENLGNAERLMLEVCGYEETRVACGQEVLTASPKRALAEWEVDFPQDSSRTEYDRAYIEIRVDLERQVYGTEEWQPFEPSSRKEVFVEASVLGQADAHLRMPVVRRGQRVILSRYSGYRDFRFAIQSSMLDADSAVVRFDLFVRLSRDAVPVGSREIVLRQKTESERQAEVQMLVERAGAKVLDAIEGFFGIRRAYVFINDWSYAPLDRRYRAEFELHWQEGLRGAWSDLTGEMQVRSDGELGSFTLIRASERAQERWDQRVGQPVIELDLLIPDQDVRATPSDRRSSRRQLP